MLRSATSAALATVFDFLCVVALVSGAGLSAPTATLAGAVAGGAVNFTLGRSWAFRSRGARVPELGRYVLVSASSAWLNAGGVGAVLWLADVPYPLAWVAARGAVFLLWNFPLQRDFVFARAVVTKP